MKQLTCQGVSRKRPNLSINGFPTAFFATPSKANLLSVVGILKNLERQSTLDRKCFNVFTHLHSPVLGKHQVLIKQIFQLMMSNDISQLELHMELHDQLRHQSVHRQAKTKTIPQLPKEFTDSRDIVTIINHFLLPIDISTSSSLTETYCHTA